MNTEGAIFGGGGLGTCYPQKFWNLEALKHHFQHSQAEICGKIALKIGFTSCSFHYLSRNSSKYPIQAIFLVHDFSCSSVAFQNRGILRPNWGRVRIRDSQSKSELSCLNRHGWTLCDWLFCHDINPITCSLSKYGNWKFYLRKFSLKMAENSNLLKKIEKFLSSVWYFLIK